MGVLYRDITGAANGGTWEKIDEIVDNGGWAPPQSSPVCNYTSDFIPTVGGGVILRDTGTSEAQYKWFSAREITPPTQESENHNEARVPHTSAQWRAAQDYVVIAEECVALVRL